MCHCGADGSKCTRCLHLPIEILSLPVNPPPPPPIGCQNLEQFGGGDFQVLGNLKPGWWVSGPGEDGTYGPRIQICTFGMNKDTKKLSTTQKLLNLNVVELVSSCFVNLFHCQSLRFDHFGHPSTQPRRGGGFGYLEHLHGIAKITTNWGDFRGGGDLRGAFHVTRVVKLVSFIIFDTSRKNIKDTLSFICLDLIIIAIQDENFECGANLT
jgi:hypothetical protein